MCMLNSSFTDSYIERLIIINLFPNHVSRAYKIIKLSKIPKYNFIKSVASDY